MLRIFKAVNASYRYLRMRRRLERLARKLLDGERLLEVHGNGRPETEAMINAADQIRREIEDILETA